MILSCPEKIYKPPLLLPEIRFIDSSVVPPIVLELLIPTNIIIPTSLGRAIMPFKSAPIIFPEIELFNTGDSVLP